MVGFIEGMEKSFDSPEHRLSGNLAKREEGRRKELRETKIKLEPGYGCGIALSMCFATSIDSNTTQKENDELGYHFLGHN